MVGKAKACNENSYRALQMYPDLRYFYPGCVMAGKAKACNENSYRALQINPDLLYFYAELSGVAPLIQTRKANGWKVITRTVATKSSGQMIIRLGGDPTR